MASKPRPREQPWRAHWPGKDDGELSQPVCENDRAIAGARQNEGVQD
jgi:hypothetical protein